MHGFTNGIFPRLKVTLNCVFPLFQVYPRSSPYQQVYPLPPKLVNPDSFTPEFREPQKFLETSTNQSPNNVGCSILTHESNIGSIIPQPPLPDLHVSERTANAAQNLERLQWTTNYQRSYNGNGPMTPMGLDNYDLKRRNAPYIDQPMVYLYL